MKKERIVVLCLCIMLSGSLHTQWIAWAWHRALPSPTQPMWLGSTEVQPGAVKNSPHFYAPSNLATALACAAWPPLSILYSEALVMRKNLKDAPGTQHTPDQWPPAIMHLAGFNK